MTCIVGIINKEQKRVTIGGDSAGVSGLNVVRRKDPKVFQVESNPSFIIGCTTSFRMIQLLRYSLSLVPVDDTDIYEYMCTTFITAVRKCFEDGGYMKEAKEGKNDEGGTFLVGWVDRLFKVGGDFQVGESMEDYEACGCGVNYAKGSLYTTQQLHEWSVAERLQESLEAAAYHSGGVEQPFIYLTT